MASSNGIKLKILVDTKNQKVVFADAGKDFVDFLFHISYLPVGTVMKLLAEHDAMGGCLTNIYQAIEKSSQAIMHPSLNKDDILNPKCVTFSASGLPTLSNIQTSTSSVFHVCKYDSNVCSAPTAANIGSSYTCNGCGYDCPSTNRLVEPSKASAVRSKGYVKGKLIYMVMDDLTVRLVSAISCVDIINGFDIKNVGTLEAKEVHLGDYNALKLLKASIQSKTALTNVFLRGTGKNLKDSK